MAADSTFIQDQEQEMSSEGTPNTTSFTAEGSYTSSDTSSHDSNVIISSNETAYSDSSITANDMVSSESGITSGDTASVDSNVTSENMASNNSSFTLVDAKSTSSMLETDSTDLMDMVASVASGGEALVTASFNTASVTPDVEALNTPSSNMEPGFTPSVETTKKRGASAMLITPDPEEHHLGKPVLDLTKSVHDANACCRRQTHEDRESRGEGGPHSNCSECRY